MNKNYSNNVNSNMFIEILIIILINNNNMNKITLTNCKWYNYKKSINNSNNQMTQNQLNLMKINDKNLIIDNFKIVYSYTNHILIII